VRHLQNEYDADYAKSTNAKNNRTREKVYTHKFTNQIMLIFA